MRKLIVLGLLSVAALSFFGCESESDREYKEFVKSLETMSYKEKTTKIRDANFALIMCESNWIIEKDYRKRGKSDSESLKEKDQCVRDAIRALKALI